MLSSEFFGLTLTAAAWTLACWVRKRTGWTACNPLMISVAVIILFLWAFDIPYRQYSAGGDVIRLMLAPVTAVLALNIYHQRKVLREYFLPVLVGCFVGSAASLACVLVLCRVMGLEEWMTASLLPKSCTTAIAIGIAESHGGAAGIATAGVLAAGLTGAVMAPAFAKVFHIKDPVAEGLAIGACSHALGTTKALEIGELQGAMSSIAICICGLFASVLTLFV